MVFGFYILLTILYTPHLFAAKDVEEFFRIIRLILFFGLANFIWAGLTLIVFQLGERFPVSRPQVTKNLFRHFFFSLLLGGVFTAVFVITVNSVNKETLTATGISLAFVINTIVNSFIYYTGSLAVHQAFFFSKKYREREFRLQQAELEMMKMQLHPHFFFNTLNAISALMYRSPKEADRMITRLGDLFRIALKKDKAQEISLEEELDFLKSFLHIHQTLMGKRLQVEWEIEPETLNALVPNLILQPLVENAIKHGIEPLEEGGKVKITAALIDKKLILQVQDSGQGFIKSPIKTYGIGLSNTQARLKNLYDGFQHFELRNGADRNGTVAEIEIPFREDVSE